MLAVSAGAQEKVYSEQGEYKLSLEQIFSSFELTAFICWGSLSTALCILWFRHKPFTR